MSYYQSKTYSELIFLKKQKYTAHKCIHPNIKCDNRIKKNTCYVKQCPFDKEF